MGTRGFGTTLSGATTGVIAEIISVGLSGQDVTDIDVSSMDSPDGWMEFIPGMINAGEIQLNILYSAAQMDAILDALGGGAEQENEDWTITFSDGSTFVCSGYLKSLGTQIPMNDKIAQTVGLKLSGKPTFTASS
jgi:hypothetical protein